MTPKNESKGGKTHINVLVNGEDFCSMYGSWQQRFKILKEALTLLHHVKNSDLNTINLIIKEIRKK